MTPTLETRPAESWDEVDQTAVGAAAAFSTVREGGREPEYFRRRTIEAPALPRENTLVGVLDGEIVTSLQIYDRQLWLAGKRCWVGGIGNVMTLPQHRGQGFASQLLEHSKEFMAEKGYAISVLRGDPDYYSQFGWIRIPAENQVVTAPQSMDSPLAEPQDSFGIDDDLDHLVSCHQEYTRHRLASFSRPSYLWTDWIFQLEFTTPGHILQYSTASGYGYAVWSSRDDQVICEELAHTFPREETRTEFLRAVWNELAERTDTRLIWKPVELPPGLESHCDTIDTEPAISCMIQVHDPPAVGTALGVGPVDTPELVDRVGETEWYWPGLDRF